MKKIRLTPIDEEFDDYDDYEDYEDYEDLDCEEGGINLNFEFDLTPYIITCAIACGILFVARFVEKHVLHMR